MIPSWRPSMMLRFVKRDGRLILQQCWIDTSNGDSWWRDVETVEGEG